MKTRVCAAICLAVVSLHARGDLVVVENVEVKGMLDLKGSVTKATMKIKGDKVRVDSSQAANPDAGVSVILNIASGERIDLDPVSKQFKKSSFTRKPAEDDTAPAKPQIIDTGKTEKMDGYDTEIYKFITKKALYTYWVAKDYPNAAAVNEQMKKARSEATQFEAADISNLDGVAIKIEGVFTQGEGFTVDVTLVSAKVQPVDDSEFQVPADYNEAPPPPTPVPRPASVPPAGPLPNGLSSLKYEELNGDYSITFTGTFPAGTDPANGTGTVLYEDHDQKIAGKFLLHPPPSTDVMIYLDKPRSSNTGPLLDFTIIDGGMLHGGSKTMLAVPAAKEKAKTLLPDLVHCEQADDIGMACSDYASEHDGKFPKQLADLLPDHLILGADEQIHLSPEKVIQDYDYLGAGVTDKEDKSTIILRSKYTTSDGGHVIVTLDGRAKIEAASN